MRIELNQVSYAYGRRRRTKRQTARPVLSDVRFTLSGGEMLAIAGKSGSGKSTLLQLMKGFLIPSQGQLALDGSDPHRSRRPEAFDRIGFIFQYPEHQLFANTVFEDIAFGLKEARLPQAELEERVRRAMASVQLDYGRFKDRSPFELSGGEKRRVAIAGVAVLEPEVLMLDEPTAGLDLQSRTSLFELLHAMNREQGITIIWVSHQLEEILEHANRLIAIRDGHIAADGRPSDLLSDAAILEAFGWEEPPALAVSRLLRELGATDATGPLSSGEAAEIIARSLRQPVPLQFQA